jgi:putative peptidoglycan lipid II flippase
MSRVFGLVRDALLAAFLGGGWVADAYTTALRIPNMLRELLGEGALSSIIVARLGGLKDEPKRMKALISQLMGMWLLILSVISGMGVMLAPFLVWMVASGFEDPEKIELSVRLTRTIFPYLLLIGLSAITMGVLHHLKIFGWSTSSSTFSNLAVIALVLLGAMKWGHDPVSMSYWIASCVVISGLVQWASQWPGLRGSGLSLVPSFSFNDPELKKILLLLGPSVMSVAAVQINVLINHNFASTMGDGAPASIYFAFRLMNLPVGIVAVAVSTVLLPTLTEKFKGDNLKEAEGAMVQAILGVSFLSFPAVVGLCLLGEDLVVMLFQRGEFTPEDSARAWAALQGFLVGIIPMCFCKNLIQGYFSRSDTRLPLMVSLFSIFVNISINATIVYVLDWGPRGLTLGTSLVLSLNMILLAVGLRAKYGMRWPIFQMLKKWFPMILMCALMGAVVSLGHRLGQDVNIWVRVISLTAIGAAVYLGGFQVLKRAFGWSLNP